MSIPVVVVYEDAGEFGPAFYPADEPGVYPPIEPEVIAQRLNAAEEDHARLRAAVAALMATGDDAEPWWGLLDGYGFVSCGFCGGPWTGCVADVTHDADCPAMALEAAMKEADDGNS